MIERFATLRRYAQSTKVDAILFTCSAFGLEIDAFKRDLNPVSMLKLNEAMLEEAVETWNRIGMLATFWTSVPPMEEEFNQIGGGASIETICAEGAMEAMLDGRPEKHNQLVAVQADNLSECNVVMSLQPRNFGQCLRSLIDPRSKSLSSTVRKLKSLIC